MRLTPGARLGAYEIVAPLGAGGMGEVYRARDPRLGREVAIKVLPADIHADPQALHRFQQEARAAASLNHPNITAVYDIGAHDGSPFIVSELLEGQTLREHLAGGPLPPARTVDLARQIAEGLSAAHEKGLVHRDLKPENIFITPDRRAKILDFGLARLMPAAAAADETGVTTPGRPTDPGRILGTAGYMAPEQVRGEPADHRADIFSFGAVLYEMLAGRRAFGGRTAIEAMTAILRDEPEELPAATRMDAPLQRIVRRCLEKRPEDRFQSARDLAFALSEAVAPLPGVTPGPAVVAGRPRIVAPLAAFAVLAIVAALAYAKFHRPPAPAAPPRIASIAVLPLDNLSNDPGQEYFADGMTEALISQLSRVGSVSVTSRTSAMAFKRGARPAAMRLPEIARALRVDAVIEGSVARAGDAVRIVVRLIPGNTDTPVWTNSYERDLRNVLALQAEVAREIAREIRGTLTPQEEQHLAARGAVAPAAEEDYLRGRYFLAKGTHDSINLALKAFTAASQKDPNYARPYAGLADAYTLLRSTYLPPHVVMPKAKEAARRAIELDPDLAEAHVSMGGVHMFYDFDWPAAERELTRAIELSPSLADAHDYYALYLAAVGRHAQARDESLRARALDPLSLMIHVDTGWVRYLAGDYAGTIEIDKAALEMDPNYWPALRDLGLAYEKTGRFEEAIAALEKARALDPNPSILEMLGGTYAAAGRKGDAQKVLAEMTQRSAREYICPYEVATVHAALGDKKKTLAWLEKGLEDRADCMPWVGSDPKLSGMKGYPGFDELMRRMGLQR